MKELLLIPLMLTLLSTSLSAQTAGEAPKENETRAAQDEKERALRAEQQIVQEVETPDQRLLRELEELKISDLPADLWGLDGTTEPLTMWGGVRSWNGRPESSNIIKNLRIHPARSLEKVRWDALDEVEYEGFCRRQVAHFMRARPEAVVWSYIGRPEYDDDFILGKDYFVECKIYYFRNHAEFMENEAAVKMYVWVEKLKDILGGQGRAPKDFGNMFESQRHIPRFEFRVRRVPWHPFFEIRAKGFDSLDVRNQVWRIEPELVTRSWRNTWDGPVWGDPHWEWFEGRYVGKTYPTFWKSYLESDSYHGVGHYTGMRVPDRLTGKKVLDRDLLAARYGDDPRATGRAQFSLDDVSRVTDQELVKPVNGLKISMKMTKSIENLDQSRDSWKTLDQGWSELVIYDEPVTTNSVLPDAAVFYRKVQIDWEDGKKLTRVVEDEFLWFDSIYPNPRKLNDPFDPLFHYDEKYERLLDLYRDKNKAEIKKAERERGYRTPSDSVLLETPSGRKIRFTFPAERKDRKAKLEEIQSFVNAFTQTVDDWKPEEFDKNYNELVTKQEKALSDMRAFPTDYNTVLEAITNLLLGEKLVHREVMLRSGEEAAEKIPLALIDLIVNRPLPPEVSNYLVEYGRRYRDYREKLKQGKAEEDKKKETPEQGGEDSEKPKDDTEKKPPSTPEELMEQIAGEQPSQMSERSEAYLKLREIQRRERNRRSGRRVNEYEIGLLAGEAILDQQQAQAQNPNDPDCAIGCAPLIPVMDGDDEGTFEEFKMFSLDSVIMERIIFDKYAQSNGRPFSLRVKEAAMRALVQLTKDRYLMYGYIFHDHAIRLLAMMREGEMVTAESTVTGKTEKVDPELQTLAAKVLEGSGLEEFADVVVEENRKALEILNAVRARMRGEVPDAEQGSGEIQPKKESDQPEDKKPGEEETEKSEPEKKPGDEDSKKSSKSKTGGDKK